MERPRARWWQVQAVAHVMEMPPSTLHDFENPMSLEESVWAELIEWLEIDNCCTFPHAAQYYEAAYPHLVATCVEGGIFHQAACVIRDHGAVWAVTHGGCYDEVMDRMFTISCDMDNKLAIFAIGEFTEVQELIGEDPALQALHEIINEVFEHEAHDRVGD